ncbi:MAG: SpoIIE family protein phosphatase [Candidatus Poribacteria bacterium]|nr:SpoIIE family protein phosphatase [Candidatus Poribacteria bacterium]
MKHKFILIFHLILVASGFIPQVSAQDTEPTPVTGKLVLTLDAVRSVAMNWLKSPWKYHPGDNPEWANPAYDDTDWESVSTLLSQKELPKSGWEGIGWFRLHFTVQDEKLKNTPLALHVAYQAGASEIYLDGELLYAFGKVGTRKEEEEHYWERNPQVITFSGKTDHVIAVRYSNFSSYQSTPVLGFGLVVAPLNESIKSRVTMVRQGTTLQMVWTAIPVFLMLQHLLLFFFYPRARENLYFALLTGSIGAFVFIIFQFFILATSATQLLYLLRLLVSVYVLIFLSGMLFLYTLFYSKLPKLFWIFLTGWGITLFVGLSDIDKIIFDITSTNSFSIGKVSIFPLLFSFTILTSLEMIRVIIVAIFKRKDSAWIFGLGSLSPFVLPFIFGFIVSRTGHDIAWELTVIILFLAPLFSMSVYLARNVSRTRRKLETEELERQLLEVENTRKTEELEEARKLQMSMLPDAPPELPNLDVAFEMRPATEVGGDYYDFNLTDDGQLTIAIGDATGHGMNAGLVVSAVKSLFKTSAPGAGNLQILERISQGIKSMNLKRLYMAMTLATFNDNTLTLASAGMPPPLIYRSEENMVEEILLEGMPLGGVIGTDREEASFELQSGDTILLMSDGLPEMLNLENEMLDYPKTKELFTEIADKSPKAIIRHIIEGSTSWADGKPQEDDVTLVVIKAK